MFGQEVSLWQAATPMLCILVPVVWVRDISKFTFTFLAGNLLIVTTVVIVMVVMVMKYAEKGVGDGLQTINQESIWTMVGFSVYVYEGIGVIMPIMDACECPERFDKILAQAFFTLTVVYCIFPEVCYIALGNTSTKTFITQELNQESKVVIIL